MMPSTMVKHLFVILLSFNRHFPARTASAMVQKSGKTIRLSEDERILVESAAADAGGTFTDWVGPVLLTAARRQLNGQNAAQTPIGWRRRAAACAISVAALVVGVFGGYLIGRPDPADLIGRPDPADVVETSKPSLDSGVGESRGIPDNLTSAEERGSAWAYSTFRARLMEQTSKHQRSDDGDTNQKDDS